MSTIRFSDLKMAPQRIDVTAHHAGRAESIVFEFSEPTETTCSLVAIALSALCGRAFEAVSFDFPVSEEATRYISALTHCPVESDGTEPREEREGSGCVLNFSGGFDSLAARALMPSNTRLVSMDFGGRFAREREFFERFDTLRVSTNVLNSPLRLNSWSMMGMGAILAAHSLKAKYISFGSIIEASVDSLRVTPAIVKAQTFPPFAAAGYHNAPFALGLSEVGTAKVLLQDDASLAVDSLLSLASPGEEKLYRKAVLLDIVADSLGVPVDIPDIKRPERPHYPFGTAFAVDMLALYVISKTGDLTARGLVRDIPAGVAQIARQLDLSFLEQVNPTLIRALPEPLRPDFYHKLASHGLAFYDESDWSEVKRLRHLISAFYPQLSD
ncbi:hypothetical protein IPU79_07605 [Micrococcus luteus]|nr:hypothetical protein [Micrococcus luteus]MBO1029050.1 hypothetical protein [Micrococcus luteus]MCV7502619.1 hypothetical protein [Micrococcus luteus]MCV7559384.1 hypothetical protein [Micrococcus luteus]